MWYKAYFLLIAFTTASILNASDPKIDDTGGPLPSWMVCPNATAVHWAKGISENVAMTRLDTQEIFLDYSAFHKFSEIGQKFVFFHECGHVNGALDEKEADSYAYNMAKTQGWLTGKLIIEVCKSLGTQEGRCEVLKEKFKKDYVYKYLNEKE